MNFQIFSGGGFSGDSPPAAGAAAESARPVDLQRSSVSSSERTEIRLERIGIDGQQLRALCAPHFVKTHLVEYEIVAGHRFPTT